MQSAVSDSGITSNFYRMHTEDLAGKSFPAYEEYKNYIGHDVDAIRKMLLIEAAQCYFGFSKFRTSRVDYFGFGYHRLCMTTVPLVVRILFCD